MPRRSFLSLTAAAAGTASLGLAGPALAASKGPFSPPQPSTYQAGYVIQSSGFSPLKLTTTFVVPKLKDCSHKNKAIAPAIFAGEAGGVGLFVGCQNGKARYFPVFRIGSNITKFVSSHAQPGDKIVLTITGNTTHFTASVVDKTRSGVSHKLTGLGQSFFPDPAVVDTQWRNWPVPDFGVIKFSASKINGHPFGSELGVTRYNLVKSGSTVQIKTGPFGSDKESFKTTFEHS
jgi:hypothetical protein